MNEESRKKLGDFFYSLVIGKDLNFSDEEIDKILKNPDCTDQIKKTLEFLSFQDSRFGPAFGYFEFMVSIDYDHDHQINNFIEKAKKSDSSVDKNITDDEFRNASYKLIPGKTYIGKFYPILNIVSGEDCVTFLKNRRVLMTGTQGLTLLPDIFNKDLDILEGKWIYSFDQIDSLLKFNGDYFVPGALFCSHNKYNYILNNFKYNLSSQDCLFCVCEK
jgi:hypothetical protein